MSNNVMGKIAKLSKESKLELKSEKVELAIIDDLKKYPSEVKNMMSELQGINKSAGDLKAKLRSIKTELNSFAKKSSSASVQLKKDLEKFKKAAANLGINPSESKEYVDANKSFTDFVELGKAADRVYEDATVI